MQCLAGQSPTSLLTPLVKEEQNLGWSWHAKDGGSEKPAKLKEGHVRGSAGGFLFYGEWRCQTEHRAVVALGSNEALSFPKRAANRQI